MAKFSKQGQWQKGTHLSLFQYIRERHQAQYESLQARARGIGAALEEYTPKITHELAAHAKLLLTCEDLFHEAVILLVVGDTLLSFIEEAKVKIALEFAGMGTQGLPRGETLGHLLEDGNEIHWRVRTCIQRSKSRSEEM